MPSLPGLPARTLRIGIRSRLGSTDPSLVEDSDTHMGLEPVFETPYAGGEGNEQPVPCLFAEPLRVESNGLVVSATVRPGITFSDGTPCTAEAIATSLRRVVDLTPRATVRARGDRVEFTLRIPDPHFATLLILELLQRDTHKFESRYEHRLVGPYPEAAARYRERSPIHFAADISSPMLILQGLDDKVVPPEHAETIVAALASAGIPHAYLAFEGEGHGFRGAHAIRRTIEATLSFLGQVLGFEPADDLAPLVMPGLDTWPRRRHRTGRDQDLEAPSPGD